MNISSPHKYSFIFTSYTVSSFYVFFKILPVLILFQLTTWDSDSVGDARICQKCTT